MTNNITFTSRCPQINTAYKVCHIINENLPHTSATKIQGIVEKLIQKYPKAYKKYVFENRMFPAHGENDLEQQILNLFRSKRRLEIDMERVRDYWGSIYKNNDFDKIYAILNQLRYDRLGNCMEDAKAAEIIMRMNGFKNVVSANLKRGKESVDHCVLIFNKDGSEFDGNWNRNTIILDAWSGICDFAGSWFKKYSSLFKNNTYIPENGKFGFRNIEKLNLSDKELDILKKEYPNLLIKK